jgi:hypothetical protein
MAISASTGFRVIYHAPLCPACGSSNITTDEIETTDGFTEEAFLCLPCGEAWPLACVTDWDTRTPHTTTPVPTGTDTEGGQ